MSTGDRRLIKVDNIIAVDLSSSMTFLATILILYSYEKSQTLKPDANCKQCIESPSQRSEQTQKSLSNGIKAVNNKK